MTDWVLLVVAEYPAAKLRMLLPRFDENHQHSEAVTPMAQIRKPHIRRAAAQR